VWGPENVTDSALAFLPAAGWKVFMGTAPGPVRTAQIGTPESTFGGYGGVWMRKIYTPSAEIAAALRQALDDDIKQRQGGADTGSNYDFQVRPESIQTRLIGGKQALSCILDYMQRQGDRNEKMSEYMVWIRTESTFIKFSIHTDRDGVGVKRWQFDPVVATAKIP
jgi:hypothetical protein